MIVLKVVDMEDATPAQNAMHERIMGICALVEELFLTERVNRLEAIAVVGVLLGGQFPLDHKEQVLADLGRAMDAAYIMVAAEKAAKGTSH